MGMGYNSVGCPASIPELVCDRSNETTEAFIDFKLEV